MIFLPTTTATIFALLESVFRFAEAAQEKDYRHPLIAHVDRRRSPRQPDSDKQPRLAPNEDRNELRHLPFIFLRRNFRSHSLFFIKILNYEGWFASTHIPWIYKEVERVSVSLLLQRGVTAFDIYD